MNRTTRMMMMQDTRGRGGDGPRYMDTHMGNPYREEDTDYRNEYRDNHEEVTGSMAESRRRRDSGGRYMEAGYGPEMRYNGGYDMREADERRMRGGEMYPRNESMGYGNYAGDYDESPEMRRASMYALPRNERPVDLIGFIGRDESEMHSGKHHKQEQRMGKTSGKTKPFDVEMAKEWTNSMEGEDGKRGPHFTFEEALNLMSQVRVDVEPIEFWAVLNAVYSDYCILFMELGISKPEIYAKFAKAWLDDVDAVPDKAAAYYEHVVQHK